MKLSRTKKSGENLLRRSCAGILLFAASALPSNAAFELVNDYEDGIGSTVWYKNGHGDSTVEVVADPILGADSGNSVVAARAGTIINGNARVFTPIPQIADGSTGTLFFRFAVDQTEIRPSGFFGATPLAIPFTVADDVIDGYGFGNNKAHINFASAGGLEYRNAGAAPVVLKKRSNLTWYKVWLVLNNETNVSSFYIQGGIFAEPALLAEDFAFRTNVTGEDINTFFFLASAGGAVPTTNGIIYVDDIYVDTAGKNLADPIPEVVPVISDASSFVLATDYSNGLESLTWSQDTFGTGTVEVVADPAPGRNVNNTVLSYRGGDVNTNNMKIVTAIPEIEDGANGTVFLRFAVDASQSPVSGTLSVSPLEAPGAHGDNNILLLLTATGGLEYHNGGTGNVNVLAERGNLTWYKAWYLIDNQNDVSSLYLQGGSLLTPTMVAQEFNFRRNDPVVDHHDLKTLLFYVNSGADGGENRNGIVYVDDVYVDSQNANLADPTAVSLEERPEVGFLKTKASMIVDGTKETAYTARGTAIERVGGGIVTNSADLSATMYGTWNDNGLYLLLDVIDDVISSEQASVNDAYRDDSVEFHFDGNMNRNGNYDGINDVKVTVHIKEDGSNAVLVGGYPAAPGGANFEALEVATVLTDTGYRLEAFFPWAGLQVYPANGWQLGLGIQLGDNDGNDLTDPADGISDREGYLIWANGTAALNFNTQNYGVVTLQAPKETVIGPTTAAITVDGTREAAYNRSFLNKTDGRWIGAGSHPIDSSIAWHALYDNDNLYLMFDITDSAIVNDSGTESWNDDSLELFLDGNNSKGGAVDNYDDVKITFRPLADGGLDIIHTGGYPLPPTGTDFSGLEAVHVITETGWSLEVKIPLSIIKLAPVPGTAFGIDFALNDDDDGAARDGMLTWSGGIELNNRTNVMGTAYLFAPMSTVLIPTDGEITADGQIDAAYSAAPWSSIQRTETNGNNFVPMASNLSAKWAGLYDDEYVYIMVDVIDNHLSLDSPTQLWNDDCIEFYFDPSNNNTGNSFDNVEDVKITVVPQQNESGVAQPPVVITTPGQFPAPPANTDFTGVEAAWVKTVLGWRVELRVPLKTLRLDTKAEAGWNLGFDIQINDDDFGGVRDHILNWSGIIALNSGVSQFGDVYLGGNPRLGLLTGAVVADATIGLYDSDLGMFVEDKTVYGDWVYHAELGWLYTGALAPWDDFLWLYSPVIDAWIATTTGIYPALSVDGDAWGHFATEGGEAWLYDYETETWMAFE